MLGNYHKPTNYLNRMDQDSVFRFSRQLIMPEIGIKGQKLMLESSVLIVGAGGLGCPAIQYLTATGVGKIGVVDYDQVDVTNLHRQVLHSEQSVQKQTHKVTSAVEAAKKINSKTQFVEYHTQLSRENAINIIKHYDVVIDATDNVPSRYLISDSCVVTNKPLVSGSALRWEGQLTVYHYKPEDNQEYGPCYRCLYPNPPPPETVTNCSDGGVLGVVPGIIGSLQALEAIKILLGIGPSYHKRLLVFDGLSCTFRNIRLRECQPNCPVCGLNPSINEENMPDYEKFCNMAATDKCLSLQILPKDKRLSVAQYKSQYFDSKFPHVLIDVRQPVEMDICQLPNSLNISIKKLEFCNAKYEKTSRGENKSSKLLLPDCGLQCLKDALENLKIKEKSAPLIVVCKQGNDSQKAVQILSKCFEYHMKVEIKDIAGGLMKWASTIDKSFMRY